MSEEYDLKHPGSRAEKSLATLTGDYSGDIPEPQSRAEAYLKKLIEVLSGDIDPSKIPEMFNDVLEYSSALEFPEEGESGMIYIAANTNSLYRWNGSGYSKVGNPVNFDSEPTEGSNNAVTSDGLKTAFANSAVSAFKALGLSYDDAGYLTQETSEE